MTAMRTLLEHGDSTIEDPDLSVVADLADRGVAFWLDVQDPTDDVIDRLAEALALHPLAVEDSKQFDQRGKVIAYGDVMMFVGFGIDPGSDDPVEVHAYLGDRCLAALGLHAAMVSNRQGAASRQLAAVATVFLPITFVVGFFGMNFDVLVADLERGWPIFLLLGVALNVLCIVVTMWWLGRRGWR